MDRKAIFNGGDMSPLLKTLTMVYLFRLRIFNLHFEGLIWSLEIMADLNDEWNINKGQLTGADMIARCG